MDEGCEDAANTGSSGRVTDSGSSPADGQTLNSVHATHLKNHKLELRAARGDAQPPSFSCFTFH